MIDVVINSFNEPKTIGKAVKSFLEQKLKEPYRITVSAPDKPTISVVKKLQKTHTNLYLFKDPGKGKSYALNLLIPKLKGRIIVLSDGDVFVKKNSLNEIIQPFNDTQIGCVTGRPVSVEDKRKILGYWSHLLCDAGAHEARLRRAKKGSFLECSGYYWAFRNKILSNFPTDVAEDTIVPILFREKGYRVKYASKAEVYVAFPRTLSDFIKQKIRTVKSHENLSKYFNMKSLPRTKSFKNEILEGYPALLYPKNLKEILYTLLLFPVRLYIWIIAFYQIKLKNKNYSDAWERIESTKSFKTK